MGPGWQNSIWMGQSWLNEANLGQVDKIGFWWDQLNQMGPAGEIGEIVMGYTKLWAEATKPTK
jgi:hypothetical protein